MYIEAIKDAILPYQDKVEIKSVRQNFDIILNHDRWIYADNKYMDEIIEQLNYFQIPFFAIVDNRGIWFANLERKYSLFLQEDFIFSITKQKRGEVKFVFNYPVFGIYNLAIDVFSSVNVDNLAYLQKLGLNYIVKLSNIEIPSSSSRASRGFVTIKIEPLRFVFKGIYLSHQHYDIRYDKIDTIFLLEFLRVMGKISSHTGSINISYDFSTKSQLFLLLKDYLLQLCELFPNKISCELPRVKDPFLKLKIIESRLEKLIKLKH